MRQQHPGHIKFTKITVDEQGNSDSSSWSKSVSQVPDEIAFVNGKAVASVVAEVTPNRKMTIRKYDRNGELLESTLGTW